jgi:mannose-6-phosphate isomerase-like protein (cupin superfamily)
MAIATHRNSTDLRREMRHSIGRHTDKSFDWDASGSLGFPDLARAQMRYIGAGGSPKVDDPNTLKPGAFTLSLVHQPVGKYAACHSHEVVEHFLVLDGVLTVGWAFGEEVIEARLGPWDMVLNQSGRPHGFRNDGVEPVLMSISVGSGSPKPPVYACHPRDGDPERARAASVPRRAASSLSILPATTRASANSPAISCAMASGGRSGRRALHAWIMLERPGRRPMVIAWR